MASVNACANLNAFQLELPDGETAEGIELLGSGVDLRWRWIRSGSAADKCSVERPHPGPQGQPLARPWNSRGLRRLHRLQRQHQSLLCYQVSSLSDLLTYATSPLTVGESHETLVNVNKDSIYVDADWDNSYVNMFPNLFQSVVGYHY